MNEFSTYEYVVQRKNQGKGKLLPITLIACYVLVVILLLAFALISKIGAPLVAFAPLALLLVVFLTWKYTKVEYEYSITSGVLTFSEIYGGRTRKQITEFKLKDCSVIASIDRTDLIESAEREGLDVTYSALPQRDAENAYFALFENEKGKKCIFFFVATEKTLKICKFYNPRGTQGGTVAF